MTLTTRTYIVLAALLWSVFVFASAPAANAGEILGAPLYIGLGNGLQGNWSFNGGDTAMNNAGTLTAFDRSGQANHGHSAAVADRPSRITGKLGQGLNFDGTDYLDLDNTGAFDLTTSFTITGWIKTSDNVAGAIMGRQDANADGFALWTDGNRNCGGTNKLALDIGSVAAGYTERCGTTDLQAGAWHHVAGVYNSVAQTMDVYVNGANDNGAMCDGCGSTTIPSTFPNPGLVEATIGDFSSNHGGQINAVLDEIRFYNRALSPDELKRLYKIGNTLRQGAPNSTGSLSQGLVGWWTMDGGDISTNNSGLITVVDRSGNGNRATTASVAATPARKIGKIGQALEFDGANDLLTATDINATDGASQMSLAAWIYQRSTTDDLGIISKFGGDTNWVWATAGGGTSGGNDMAFWPQDTNAVAYTQGDAHQANVWEHWVVVFDGTQTGDANRVRMFKNGVQQAGLGFTATIPATTNNTATAISLTDSIGFFDGMIDDARIYSRAITPDEIKRLYKMGSTLKQGVASSNGSLSNGLVGYWSFNGNDVAGNRANDLSGRGNHGTLTDDISQLTRPERAIGKIGQALNFDGVNDLVDIESNMDVSGSGITLAAWAKPTSLTTDFRIISKSNGTQEAAHMWMLSNCSSGGCAGNNELRARIGISGTTWTFLSSNLFFERDVWQFVAVTYDGDAVRFFKNGVSETQDAANGTVDTDNTMNVYIGSNHDGGGAGGNPFPGLIDEVRVYERALSVDELKRLYNMGR